MTEYGAVYDYSNHKTLFLWYRIETIEERNNDNAEKAAEHFKYQIS